MNNANEIFNSSDSDSQNRESLISVVIVTGLSGAGKSITLRSLEDLGFYCIDNLPIPLISEFLRFIKRTQPNQLKIAFGIDARGREFLDNFIIEVDKLKQSHLCKNVKTIFLNADTQTLLKRFQETRRKHPLANGIDLTSAIEEEKKILAPIMSRADTILETNILNIHELRSWIRKSFDTDLKQQVLSVNLISFGFKYGVPPESNLVYDLRFLPNPYFIPELKNKTGKDKNIQEYLFAQKNVQDYWSRLHEFLHYSLQKSFEEGRFFATVAIGCTGGKHRSVSFVEKIAEQVWPHILFIPQHRDIAKE